VAGGKVAPQPRRQVTDYRWVSPRKLLASHINHIVEDVEVAEKQVYFAVISGEVANARSHGKLFGLNRSNGADEVRRRYPFVLPPDIKMSVDDERRK
jgi:hypothetical protein